MCQQSEKAKYTQRVDYIVQLPVPIDQATNTGEGLIARFPQWGKNGSHTFLDAHAMYTLNELCRVKIKFLTLLLCPCGVFYMPQGGYRHIGG